MFETKLATSTIILIYKFQNSVKKKVKISSRFAPAKSRQSNDIRIELPAFLFQQPRIVLPAIHNPVHIHRVIANLIQYEIPVFYKQFVILVYRNIVLIEERIALGHFLQRADVLQKPMLQFDCRRSADLSQKAQVQRKAEYS